MNLLCLSLDCVKIVVELELIDLLKRDGLVFLRKEIFSFRGLIILTRLLVVSDRPSKFKCAVLVVQVFKALLSSGSHWSYECASLALNPLLQFFLLALVHHHLKVATNLSKVLVLKFEHVDALKG